MICPLCKISMRKCRKVMLNLNLSFLPSLISPILTLPYKTQTYLSMSQMRIKIHKKMEKNTIDNLISVIFQRFNSE